MDGADRSALLPALVGVDAVLIRSATKMDAEAVAAATQLKVIARAGVGLDNVDIKAATAAGVMVVNAPTSNIVSAAEHAVALLLAAARRIPAANASLKGGAWKRAKYTGVEVNEKTIGVVGSARSASCSPTGSRRSTRRSSPTTRTSRLPAPPSSGSAW